MIKSRLRQRQTVKTVDVVTRSYASGVYSDSYVYRNLNARYEQQQLTDLADDWGKSTEVVDVFWFEELSTGLLPVIEPKHFILDGTTRYEVITTTNQAGGGSRLKVTCRRYTTPGD